MPSPEHPRPQTEREKDPTLELAETLRPKEQYLAQVKVLYQSGLLENFPATKEHPLPETGIFGIDGEQYVLPSYENILEKLQAKREIIEKKREQGFTKLLLIPFALPLSVLIQRYKDILLKTHQEKGLKATDGSTLELDIDNPLYVWEDLVQADNPDSPKDKQLEYQVQNYEGKTKEQRGGKTKQELLQDPENGWQILLIEDNPDLPAHNQGKTIAGRKQLEANKSPVDYLKLLQTDPQHQNEQGLTPEANLTLWLTHLQETQTAIDDYQGQGKANCLVGSYLSGYVPYFYWFRGGRRAGLSWSNSGSYRDSYGARASVEL